MQLNTLDGSGDGGHWAQEVLLDTADDDIWYQHDAAATLLAVVQEGFQISQKQVRTCCTRLHPFRVLVYSKLCNQRL